MVMRMTSTVATIIHAVSPLLGTGAGAAAAAGAAGTAPGASAAATTTGAAGADSADASIGTATSNIANNTPVKFFIANRLIMGVLPLERIFAGFAGADAGNLFEIGHEDLAVADLVGAGRLDDRLDHAIEHFLVDRDLEFHLGQKIHDVFRPAVKLGVSLLAAEPLDFRDGDALHPDLGERVAHLVALEGVDNGGNEFHVWLLRAMALQNTRLMLSMVTPPPKPCGLLLSTTPAVLS